MNQQPASRAEEAAARPVREYITYVIAGAITFGLVGLILGLVLRQNWIVFVGLALGAVSGLYLAWRHQVDLNGPGKNSNQS
ncbi:hypothetical protein [Galactobacter caseinivorans]|uniref:Uncharacterized protein n=1 Tax=Galactobacter caseinivorans TaxID=2676123 RepID=A0A496PMT5_9MICC|nr:hypothetical protein [Galactobacter caseinivorans]RKW71853.1 hypothetical protein DWQ67_03220 [Galactobacter caseinivorans]